MPKPLRQGCPMLLLLLGDLQTAPSVPPFPGTKKEKETGQKKKGRGRAAENCRWAQGKMPDSIPTFSVMLWVNRRALKMN